MDRNKDASASDVPLLEVEDLKVHLNTPRGTLKAVDGVSFRIGNGQTLGLVGESGSGKSMLVRSLMGISPSIAKISGSVKLSGAELVGIPRKQARAVWGNRVAMVFQDPMTSLNPVVRIDRQLTESMREHLDMSRADARTRAVDLLKLVGIPEPEKRAKQYPHQLSGGMRQRVTIAMALACDPDLLIADEATTALDVTVQRQILDLLQEIQADRGMGMILVSHDLGVVAGRTDEIAVMYAGRMVEHSPTQDLFAHRRHRYTEALLAAVPRLDVPKDQRPRPIPGSPPDLVTFKGGCAFAARCTAADDVCRTERPVMTANGNPRHLSACHHPVAVGGETEAAEVEGAVKTAEVEEAVKAAEAEDTEATDVSEAPETSEAADSTAEVEEAEEAAEVEEADAPEPVETSETSEAAEAGDAADEADDEAEAEAEDAKPSLSKEVPA
ncbi:ABC transporter ATP-binding protein [Yinghuangia seranimata]|uniref:ABC transporter ATP-binding protein n=1 Tax=Yinghuangia seranimata TaxID=408067 RepID=UPI00248B2E77|nr:ABC transporter ATP-binding protein [Yinghuangia seranimata]MDI2129283.1 ABC transporter ATP-binding protein [Yinghuangia seranimata]